ncbi:MAG: hypothetical protein Kow0079_00690 [Vicingaceae bacterium]
MKLKHSFLSILLTLLCCVSLAQSFNGTIHFQKINYLDTTNYVYYIFGDNVRIDELDNKNQTIGTMLVDLKTEKVYALNHLRKLYIELNRKPTTKDLSKTKYVKTNETKTILGKTAVKWEVSNKTYKSIATYWVIEGNYDFFKKTLSIVKQKDLLSLYFLSIPENQNVFPILSEEVTEDGVLRTRFEVMKIIPNDHLTIGFSIPEDYQLFQN